MPKIDPLTLLKTLGVLLSSKGGIRSSDEVTRLVQLMHKFSKKLVSKCIYIQILKATNNELVAKFLDEEGWDLLNAWFSDAILERNWALCKELIKLFLVCPVTAGRLEDNLALNLIKKLTSDVKMDGEVSSLASRVLKKWMAIISPVKEPVVVDSEVSAHQNNSKKNGDVASIDEGINKKKGKLSLKSRKSIDNETVKQLLNGFETTVSLKKEKENKSKSKNGNNDRTESKKEKSKEIEKEERKIEKSREKKHKSERGHRENQKEKDHREKKSKPYSQTELKDDLGDVERNRIKMMAQKMKEDLLSKNDSAVKGEPNVSKSTTAGLGKIPKIPKKENKEKGGHSFNDLMGSLDSKKATKTVKVASSKNRNKGLMESLSSTNFSKQPSSKCNPNKTNFKNISLSSSSRECKVSSHETTIEVDKSKDLNNEKKVQNNIIGPATKSEKRPAELDRPNVLKESNMFGNVFSTVMHDDFALDQHARKKRKLSDVDDEKELANIKKIESEKEMKNNEILHSLNFYGGGEEGRSNTMENEEERTSDSEVGLKVYIPRDVSGILVMAKGSTSTKKNIHWESDENLVRIEYFEMDETERVNVNKVKFETMRQREAAMEKTRLISLVNNGPREEEGQNSNSGNDRIPWRLIKLDSIPPLNDFGNGSNEKVVQTQREKTVLQALIFDNKKPPDLSEPDFCVTPEEVPITVPLEDASEGAENSMVDYSFSGWPAVSQDPVPSSFLASTNFNVINSAVQPEMKNDLMGCRNLPSESVDNNLFAIQLAAAETLRQEGYLPPQSPFEGGLNRHLSLNNISTESLNNGPMKPNIEPLQNNSGPTNFYGNGMENVNGLVSEPYFNGSPPQMGRPALGLLPIGNNSFQSQVDQRGRNRGAARGFVGGFGRGFPSSGPSNRGFGNLGRAAGLRLGNEGHRIRGGKKQDRSRGGKKQDSRPCKFWMERGHCKYEDKCRFKHPSQ